MGKRDKNNCQLGCRLTKRLLGQVLVDGEFVLPKDLEVALDRQKQANELLGETLVRMGALDQRELDAVLFVQGDFASLKDSAKAAAGVRQLLDELLIRARRITPEQLELAMSEQIKVSKNLGETLVHIGLITESELDAVLAFQKCQGCESSSSRLRLGEILVATNHISREQLEKALIEQKISKKKIGEVLVEAGYIEPHHISFALGLQQKLVTAALIATLSLASAQNIEAAHSANSGAGASSAKLTVTATVQARASLKVLFQSPELVVTNADVARGFVEVGPASRIEIRNNNPAGYFLVFEGMGGPIRPFKDVHVRFPGREVQIDFSGGMVAQPDSGRGSVTMELSYRFALTEDARPGTYSWPLSMSVVPK